jgi:hypothetical protein
MFCFVRQETTHNQASADDGGDSGNDDGNDHGNDDPKTPPKEEEDQEEHEGGRHLGDVIESDSEESEESEGVFPPIDPDDPNAEFIDFYRSLPRALRRQAETEKAERERAKLETEQQQVTAAPAEEEMSNLLPEMPSIPAADSHLQMLASSSSGGGPPPPEPPRPGIMGGGSTSKHRARKQEMQEQARLNVEVHVIYFENNKMRQSNYRWPQEDYLYTFRAEYAKKAGDKGFTDLPKNPGEINFYDTNSKLINIHTQMKEIAVDGAGTTKLYAIPGCGGGEGPVQGDMSELDFEEEDQEGELPVPAAPAVRIEGDFNVTVQHAAAYKITVRANHDMTVGDFKREISKINDPTVTKLVHVSVGRQHIIVSNRVLHDDTTLLDAGITRASHIELWVRQKNRKRFPVLVRGFSALVLRVFVLLPGPLVQHLLPGIPSAWVCALGHVLLGMCSWVCALGYVLLGMCSWVCALGYVLLGMCSRACARRFSEAALFSWYVRTSQKSSVR